MCLLCTVSPQKYDPFEQTPSPLFNSHFLAWVFSHHVNTLWSVKLLEYATVVTAEYIVSLCILSWLSEKASLL